ncbi:hypothetical protein QCM77_07195 [Bradyrhizobium sp. SSUT18]|uniref:hypothetical protein n=1 Tax=unclassified Bradyrhizobium TaxID=2631580 RepID=UPI002447F6FD|nr:MULTISPECIES: hypothetical protein [unclassified Bradyrhizobium]MDH2343352.1 hypothetical protein [Bradyrhizobium sp. SSUT77]MDH2350181.1 hypothetical protein [Bradyrhizobium sp. SSUT112]MDH2399731.1 hypothetical protein [Bradyrhizobium sp. SSUT18]
MQSQALQTMTPARAQAASPERAAVIPATGFASGADGLSIRAIFGLPVTWWQRSRFRAELRADLRDKPEFLRDIGMGAYEAQAEASRYFWEAVILERR